jgi:hypothetical protein
MEHLLRRPAKLRHPALDSDQLELQETSTSAEIRFFVGLTAHPLDFSHNSRVPLQFRTGGSDQREQLRQVRTETGTKSDLVAKL